MVRHIVIWRLNEAAKGGGRIASLERIERNLEAMRTQLTGLRRIELGVNAVPGPDAADLVLLAEFDSWEALRAYETDPLHVELKALIGPLRSERRVLDYELEAPRSR